jgi:hypothetical protein
VSSSLLLGEENSGGLYDVGCSSGPPWDVGGVPLAEDCDLLSIDDLNPEKVVLANQSKFE